MQITLHTDGGSLNNPGKAGIGFLVHSEDKLLHKHSEYIGIASNNVAEYTALIKALEYVQEHLSLDPKTDKLQVFADSELMIRQMLGQYKVKNADLRPLYERAKDIENALPLPVKYTHVLRHLNADADALVKAALGR
ncbi:MAG: ribonuclease HI family protein [Weeksellaceae bacterium]